MFAHRMVIRHGCLAIVGLMVWTYCLAAAENGPLPSRLTPAEESYQAGEARRQDLIARQLGLNDRMLSLSIYGPRAIGWFEPWPAIPGDIWGYPGPRPIEHPVGHESLQTGKDRWIYRPLYERDLLPPQRPPVVAPVPTLDRKPLAPRVELPAPSDLGDDEPPARAKPPRQGIVGPREF